MKYLPLLLLLIACSSNTKDDSGVGAERLVQVKVSAENDNKFLGKGIILLDEKNYSNEFINFYHDDLSIWKKIKIENFVSSDIIPFSYSAEKRIIVFRCMNIGENYYEVVVNEKSNNKKYILKDPSRIKFKEWENYILDDVFSVDFDLNSNPIRILPSINSDTKFISPSMYGGYIFQPVTVKNEWLQIKWESDDGEFEEGWIKWRDQGELLIVPFYFA